MIPKILHQVWLGDEKIPEQFQNFTNIWKTLHPDWQYILWTEKELKDTECWKLITKCDKYSSKSNVARLYAILKIGGVYSDFDIEWKKNIDCLLSYRAFASKELPTKYCNAFFGAVKNHSWIKYQYLNLKKYVKLPAPWGPTLMTNACKLFPHEVFTIDTKLVYPYLWNQKELKDNDYSESYVVHHWNLSRYKEKS